MKQTKVADKFVLTEVSVVCPNCGYLGTTKCFNRERRCSKCGEWHIVPDRKIVIGILQEPYRIKLEKDIKLR